MSASFDQAKIQWQQHNCQSEAGICDCSFEFHCEGCGQTIKAIGESMDLYIGFGGICENCNHRDITWEQSTRDATQHHDDCWEFRCRGC